MTLPECNHRCRCSDCWGVEGDAAHPIFSKRNAIIEALRDAGLSLAAAPINVNGRTQWVDKPQSDAAVRFHAKLFEQGFEVVRRHQPHTSEAEGWKHGSMWDPNARLP